MKKDITNLINSAEGTFRLNNIAKLKRWTKSALGEKVDKLCIEFDNINHVCFGLYDNEIKARDFEGIIAECEEKMQAFFTEVSARLCSDLRNGYRCGISPADR